MLQSLNHDFCLLGYFVIWGVSRNGRIFQCFANRYIAAVCQRSWNLKLKSEIFSNSDDNYPMPRLRHSIFFKFIQMCC
jgi:hypothetical protein